jgi:hypothetical protein
MDKFVKHLSERLASNPTRRGFLAKLGKVTLGVAAVATGLDVTQRADAGVLRCCTGGVCPSEGCPSGTNVGYTWSCGRFQCHDCYTTPATRSGYRCTYEVHV